METNGYAKLNRMVGAVAENTSTPETVLVYEDFGCGLAAKTYLDEIFRRAEPLTKCHFNMWKFTLLRAPALKAQATQEANAAPILCLAAHTGADWPSEVAELLGDWLADRHGGPSLLVVLLEGVDDDEEFSTASLPLDPLRKVAQQLGAEFLACVIPPRATFFDPFIVTEEDAELVVPEPTSKLSRQRGITPCPRRRRRHRRF